MSQYGCQASVGKGVITLLFVTIAQCKFHYFVEIAINWAFLGIIPPLCKARFLRVKEEKIVMSKPIKLLTAAVLSLAAILTAYAEPAALGRLGADAGEVNAANIACLSCSDSAKAAPGATMVRDGATAGFAAFRPNSGAGSAVLNGPGLDAALGNTKEPVPEPATIGLVGAGLAALAFGLKRRS